MWTFCGFSNKHSLYVQLHLPHLEHQATLCTADCDTENHRAPSCWIWISGLTCRNEAIKPHKCLNITFDLRPLMTLTLKLQAFSSLFKMQRNSFLLLFLRFQIEASGLKASGSLTAQSKTCDMQETGALLWSRRSQPVILKFSLLLEHNISPL